MISIVDVMRDLRIEPEPRLCWSVGARIRELWLAENGELPEKRLKEKTNGEGGSHCFAVYPASWRERIIAVIADYRVQQSRQLEMPL